MHAHGEKVSEVRQTSSASTFAVFHLIVKNGISVGEDMEKPGAPLTGL